MTAPDVPSTPAPRPDQHHPPCNGVLATLAVHHVDPQVVSLPDAVRTAAAAAAALGITPAEIANSLIFRAHDARRPDHARCSSSPRARTRSTWSRSPSCSTTSTTSTGPTPTSSGRPPGSPSAASRRSATPPGPHLVDVSLSRYRHVWAAAGHSHTVFRTTYEELLRVTGGHAIEVA